jgi:hypothetical protein
MKKIAGKKYSDKQLYKMAVELYRQYHYPDGMSYTGAEISIRKELPFWTNCVCAVLTNINEG